MIPVKSATEPNSRADMIGGSEGSDPASVVFDAVSAAKARRADVLLIISHDEDFLQLLIKIFIDSRKAAEHGIDSTHDIVPGLLQTGF